MVVNKQNYQCPRCGFETDRKTDMMRHFKRKTGCPACVHLIELTEDVKAFVLQNRIFKPEQHTRASSDTKSSMKKNSHIIKLALELQYYKNKKSEHFYQLLLENMLNGTHKTLDSGITDVTTDCLHAEIKEWTNWKSAIGQLVCYNMSDPKEQLHAYFFGKRPKDVNTIFEIAAKCNIKPFEIVHCEDDSSVIINDSKGECVYIFKPGCV